MPWVLQLAGWVAALASFALCQPHPSVGVFMDFDSAPAPLLLRIMESEVNDFFKQSGLSLDWQLARGYRGDQTFSGLVTLKFKGSLWWVIFANGNGWTDEMKATFA